MAVMYIGPRSRGGPDSGFFESSSRDGGRRAASRVPRSGEGGEKASQAVRRGTPPGDAFAEQHGRCSEDLRQEAPPGGAPRQGRPAGGLRRAARRPDALGGARRRRRAGGRRRRSTARRRRGARGGRGRRRRRRTTSRRRRRSRGGRGRRRRRRRRGRGSGRRRRRTRWRRRRPLVVAGHGAFPGELPGPPPHLPVLPDGRGVARLQGMGSGGGPVLAGAVPRGYDGVQRSRPGRTGGRPPPPPDAAIQGEGGLCVIPTAAGGGGGGGGIALCGTGRGSSGAAKKRSPFEKVGPPVLGTFARGAHQGRWDRREGGRGPLANSQNCPPRRAGSPTPPGPSWKGRRVSFRTGLKCPACHAGAHPRGPHERREVDVSSDQFAFPWGDRRILPNLRPDWSDLLGERFSGRYLDDALARGFFYVPGGGSLFFSVLCLAPRPPPRPPRHLVKATHP